MQSYSDETNYLGSRKMARRREGGITQVPWYNPLRYITARAENTTWSSHHRLVRERLLVAKSLYRRDLKAHYGCVNAIEFSNDGLFIASGGDDRRVLLWNVEKALSEIGEPFSLKGEHNSNIFCLAVNNSNSKLYSGGNDEQVVVHDVLSGQTLDVFRHEEAVYGLSADPNNENIFASACDDGRILIFDTREPASADPFVLASYTSSMHAVMYNPAEPHLLATANAKEGVGLWDIRKPRNCVLRYGGRYLQQSCMSVRINARGSHLVALRRRLPPVLYELGSTHPLCDLDHDGYYNSCTMKSCSFAGPNDEYVLSGSDDFNLYMWKIPEDLSQRVYAKEAHVILHGHRSIVNQVRYDRHSGLIISSGVEKVIKMWSPFMLNNGTGGVSPRWESAFTERPVYTHEEYINLVLRSGLVMSHDYTSQSVEEDPRMMAFFDSLVQRELEYWSSDEDLSSNEIELYDSILQATRRNQQLDRVEENSNDNLDQGEDGGGIGEGHTSDSSNSSEFSPFTLAFASVMAAHETDASLSRVLDAHDESERLRNAVGEVTERGRSRMSSRSNRKSISEIIAQNRKEVMRAAELRHRSIRSSHDLHADIPSSMSSESESDDQVPGPSVSTDLDIGHMLNKRSAQQQRAAYQLKRLQALRTRLVTSDTDNSCDDSPPRRKRPRFGSHSSREEAVGETVANDSESSTQPCASDNTPVVKSIENGEGNVDVAAQVHCSKGKAGFEHEAGPYLQQADGPAVTNHHTASSSSHPESTASTSGTGTARHTSSSEDVESVNSSRLAGSSGAASHRDSNTDPALNGMEPSDEDSSQPVWTEFKKFKKRLERARRYYRQKTSNRGDSSDSD